MGKIFDTYQVTGVETNEATLVKDGYSAVALYFFTSSAFKQPLTPAAAKKISAGGLYLISVWENGTPTKASYFSAAKGKSDGVAAVAEAIRVGQPKSTPEYFAVDYDATHADLPKIIDYFTETHEICKDSGYPCGVYGSGLVCKTLKDLGLVEYTWISESKGYAGYAEWKPKADLVQTSEGHLLSMDVDFDTSAGHGGGWKAS